MHLFRAVHEQAHATVVQAAQEEQSQRRQELLASLSALTSNSQQGTSPGAIARRASAHQASAKTVLQQVRSLSSCTPHDMTATHAHNSPTHMP